MWIAGLVGLLTLAGVAAGTTYDEALAAAGDGKYIQVNGEAQTPTTWSITVEFEVSPSYIWLHFAQTSTDFQYTLYNGNNPVSSPQIVFSASAGSFGPLLLPGTVTRVEIAQRQSGNPGVVYLDAVTDGTYDEPGTAAAGYYAHTGVATAFPDSITVDIDIKPGSYPNSINLGSNGVVPVAILSSTEFDATTVDPATVTLAGAGVAVRGKGDKLLASTEDVNGDGLLDLSLKVETENLDPGAFQDGYAILAGETYGGEAIEGMDEITIVPE